MAKKMKLLFLMSVLLLVVNRVAYSRSIIDDSKHVEDGVVQLQVHVRPSSLVEGSLGAAVETCEPVYGFLPCSNNIWGLLFLIVVYEILLTFGGKFVAKGSEVFFQLIGPGIVGASLFQFLGTIPQIVLVLVSSLSGTNEEAQQRATLGVGLVAGTTVMLLTLIWGISVVLGSYDFTGVVTIDKYGLQESPKKGYGVVTDVETCYTARVMLISLIPFLIILLAKAFPSPAGKKIIYLVALIITFVLLIGYICSQVFDPWIQNRRFEYLMNKYAKDKLLALLSSNGLPDADKIHQMFHKIDKNRSNSVSASEIRVLLLGLKIDDDDDDLETERNIEIILESFDISGDGQITRDEFVKQMMNLVTELSDQHPDRITRGGGNNKSQEKSPLQQNLLRREKTIKSKVTVRPCLNYSIASFYIVLGIAMLCALSTPLLKSTVKFAEVAHLSSFIVSYLAIPLSTNYRVAIQSIFSSQEKTQKSISLTLSSLYGGIFMNNIIGMISYLAPVYARDLEADVFAQVLVVLVICIGMTLLASFRTTFYRWMGFLILSLYPISLALIYLVNSALGG